MKPVILESPYAGDIERNLRYARRALLDSLGRGEAPIASHLLYPQALDDNDPRARMLGINAGFAWWPYAEIIVFYIDLGWSKGMQEAWDRCSVRGLVTDTREIGA